MHNNLLIYSTALLSFIINTESHATDSTNTCKKPHKATHGSMHVCVHTHAQPPDNHPPLLFFFFSGHTHCMCLMGPYMWCVMWLTGPLPSCPPFKPSSSSGCLSPGVDCIFYLSFALPWLYLPQLIGKKRKKKEKFWGKNCNQHNMPSSCCVLGCHSSLSVSMRDETDSTCRRRRAQPCVQSPLCVYQIQNTHTHTYTPIPLFTHKHAKGHGKRQCCPLLSVFFKSTRTHNIISLMPHAFLFYPGLTVYLPEAPKE